MNKYYIRVKGEKYELVPISFIVASRSKFEIIFDSNKYLKLCHVLENSFYHKIVITSNFNNQIIVYDKCTMYRCSVSQSKMIILGSIGTIKIHKKIIRIKLPPISYNELQEFLYE